jgi:hypothetical protein
MVMRLHHLAQVGIRRMGARAQQVLAVPPTRGRLTMTTVQGWVLVIEVGIIALAYLIGLFRGRAV